MKLYTPCRDCKMHKVHIIPCLLGGVPCFCCIFPLYSWQCVRFTTTVMGKKDNLVVTNYRGSAFCLKLTTYHNKVINTLLFPKRALNWSPVMALISCEWLQNTAVFPWPSFRKFRKEIMKINLKVFNSSWIFFYFIRDNCKALKLIPLQFIKYSILLVHKWL